MHAPYTRQKKQGFSRVVNPTRRSGQKFFEISRVGSGRVGRFSNRRVLAPVTVTRLDLTREVCPDPVATLIK